MKTLKSPTTIIILAVFFVITFAVVLSFGLVNGWSGRPKKLDRDWCREYVGINECRRQYPDLIEGTY